MIHKLEQFLDFMTPILKNIWIVRRTFFIFNAITIILFALFLLFIYPSEFVSSITILPDYGNKPTLLGQLGDIASLAGVDIGKTAPTEIYEILLTSETVMENAFYKQYKTERYQYPVNLIQYFDLSKKDGLDSIKTERDLFLRVRDRFKKNNLKTSVDRLTTTLNIQVKMNESQLSADVVNNLVVSLDEFVREKRKSYAIEQRKYIEKRRVEVSDSLSVSEDRVKTFQNRNKVYLSSPGLVLELSRLSRSVQIYSTVLFELTKQYELAKIEEIKDTPVINVQEYARDPIQKEGPRKLIILAFFVLVSVFLSGAYLINKSKIQSMVEIIKLRIQTIIQ